LDPDLRRSFERRFGADFQDLRVHTDASAAALSTDLHALAFTNGRDVYFAPGTFAPHTPRGERLLAHELTHVVQQRATTGVQRKASAEEAGSTVAAGARAGAVAAIPTFGNTAPDIPCPAVPTFLGRLAPEPPCPPPQPDIVGEPFHFCRGSDVFSPSTERSALIAWARERPAASLFTIRGYASDEGMPAENINLSCHRAKRAARELQNAGVRSERIEIAGQGTTRRFPPDPALPHPTREQRLAANRVVVVRADAPAAAAATATPTNPREIVNVALGRLERREYRLAADAYISLWTCGRVPNLWEAARRTTIRIEGEGPLAVYTRNPLAPGDPRLGVPVAAGRNAKQAAEALRPTQI